jgi:TonB family protein
MTMEKDKNMKTILSTLLLLCIFSLGFAQDLRYEVRGKYVRGVSKEKLISPKTMSDIRPGYPSSMIEGYTSTEIVVNNHGKISKATGANEVLSEAQQGLLQTAEVGSEIEVNIGYIYQNPVTLIPDVRQMHFVITVVPEVEAEYPGGYQALQLYLKENAISKIPSAVSTEMPPVLIQFTVDEAGKIIDTRVAESSKDPAIDKVLLKAIRKMPDWKPATDADGKHVPQDFEFSVGNTGC